MYLLGLKICRRAGVFGKGSEPQRKEWRLNAFTMAAEARMWLKKVYCQHAMYQREERVWTASSDKLALEFSFCFFLQCGERGRDRVAQAEPALIMLSALPYLSQLT